MLVSILGKKERKILLILLRNNKMLNKIIKKLFWGFVNRLPTTNSCDKLRVFAVQKFYKNTKISKGVLIQKNFVAPLDIELTVGNDTVIKNNFCIYFDEKSVDHSTKHMVAVGNRCHILSGVTFDCSGNIIVGNNVHIGRNVKIFTHDHVLTDCNKNIEDTDVDIADVKIGNNVVIFDDVVILRGSELASGTVVGIRSVVKGKFIDENKVLAGMPAKVIKDR